MPEPRTVVAPPAPPHSETRVGESTNPVADGDADTPEQVGRFRLLWELARGGMGVVYRAIDPDLNRVVAVKLVRGPNDPATHLRFVEEAKVTAQLQHPGIPPVYEAGELPDGRPYLAMKLIKGRTLADLLADRKGLSDDRPRFVAAFENIAQAIGYAHSQGVIHRDLKPQNVMVGAFGEVQVMDWGLARTAEREGQKHTTATAYTDGAAFRTVVGSVVGTPAFCAPEQARGDLDAVGERSDVFGLGAVLCSILTGRPPFDAPDGTTALTRAAAGDTAEAFANLDTCGADAELIALCKRCLAADPTDRPATGKDVADEVARLRAAADERAKAAEVERAKADTRAAASRVRQRLTLIAAGVLTAIGLVAGWQWLRAEGEGERAKGEQKKAEGEQKKAEAEQRKAEVARDDLTVEKGKTDAALAETLEEQKKTLVAWGQARLQRARSLTAVRQLTDQVAVNPFRSIGGMVSPLAVREKVADLWDGFMDDDDEQLAAEASLWAAALRWDATKPADTVTAMSAALKKFDATPHLPSNLRLRDAAAFGPAYIGLARTEGGRAVNAAEGAPAEYRTSVERFRKLAADNPQGGSRYRTRLAEALALIATLDQHNSRAAAAAAAREALALRRELALAAPTDAAAQTDLNVASGVMFQVWGAAPHYWPADAEHLLRENVADEVRRTEAWTRGGKGPYVYGSLGKARRRLGGWLRLHGKYADAEKELRAAVESYDETLKVIPGLPSVRLEAAAAHTDLGECLTAAGKGEEAVGVLERCEKEMRALADGWKATPATKLAGIDANLELADTLAFLAHAHAAAGSAEKARDTAAACRKLFDPLDAKTPNFTPTAPRVLGQLALAEIALRMADKDAAAVPLLVEKFDAELTRRVGDKSHREYPGPVRWELAKKLIEANEPAKAVEQLSKVIESGFTHRDLLAADFAPLKDRDDFQKLLAQLPDPKK